MSKFLSSLPLLAVFVTGCSLNGNKDLVAPTASISANSQGRGGDNKSNSPPTGPVVVTPPTTSPVILTGPNATYEEFSAIISAGSWVVASYFNGGDKTSSFKDIKFTFNPQLTGNYIGMPAAVVAEGSNGSNSSGGTWFWGDNSYYTPTDDTRTVTFKLVDSKPFKSISTLWTIKNSTASNITLVSGNPSENAVLVFGR